MTNTAAIRRLPFAMAVFAIVAGIAVWVACAGPAGASASFDSPLRASAKAAKFGAFDAAPYTEAALVKRATAVAKAKTGKKLTSVPGAVTAAPAATTSGGGGELGTARSILAEKIAQYPILAGSTVEFGDARGYQAISYYRSGRIVISPTHTASLDRILSHEIWHIIDWRDNGVINWGENIPPK